MSSSFTMESVVDLYMHTNLWSQPPKKTHIEGGKTTFMSDLDEEKCFGFECLNTAGVLGK